MGAPATELERASVLSEATSHRVWRQCSVGVCLSSKVCHEVCRGSMVSRAKPSNSSHKAPQDAAVQFKGSLRSGCSMCTDDAGRTVLAVGSRRAGRAYWMTSGGEVGDGRSDLKCKFARVGGQGVILVLGKGRGAEARRRMLNEM